jgi:hypothetical protein
MVDIAHAKYISFGTYRKDGTLVSTPTWVVPFREGFVFTTQPDSWKTKRLLRDHRVVVTPCDIRGRALPGASTYQGRGELLEDAFVADARRAVRSKYRVMWALTIAPRRLVQRLRGAPEVADCAIYFVLEN